MIYFSLTTLPQKHLTLLPDSCTSYFTRDIKDERVSNKCLEGEVRLIGQSTHYVLNVLNIC